MGFLPVTIATERTKTHEASEEGSWDFTGGVTVGLLELMSWGGGGGREQWCNMEFLIFLCSEQFTVSTQAAMCDLHCAPGHRHHCPKCPPAVVCPIHQLKREAIAGMLNTLILKSIFGRELRFVLMQSADDNTEIKTLSKIADCCSASPLTNTNYSPCCSFLCSLISDPAY